MEDERKYHRLYKFPNGATLIYYRQNLDSTTKLAVGFLGGASKDGKIKGTAHFLEHILIQETPKYSKSYINRFMRNNNITSNAFTSSSYITLYADTPNSRLEELCKLYSELLYNRTFNKQKIDLERKAIEQEILMDAAEYDPKEEEFMSAIQLNYKKDTILGTKNTIEKIDDKVLQNYIDNDFVSENLVITVVSSLEFEQIKTLMEKSFVNKAKSNPELKFKPETPEYYPPTNIHILDTAKNLKTAEISISYLVKQTEKEASLFKPFEEFVFNGFSGRLMRQLRTKRGLVYDASFDSTPLAGDMSLKSIVATTSKNHIKEVIDTIGNIIKDLYTRGISERDYQDFQNLVYALEERKSGIKIMEPLVLLSRYVLDSEIFYNNQTRNIKKLTRDDVNNYLKRILKNSNIIFNIVGDFDEKSLYSLKEVEKRLHAKTSKLLFNKTFKTFLEPDTLDFVMPSISTEQFFELNDSGKVGFVYGSYIEQALVKKYFKKLGLQPRKTKDKTITIDDGKELEIVITTSSAKPAVEQNDEYIER